MSNDARWFVERRDCHCESGNVSEPTLRRWDELGKFVARRHPINGYRLYDRAKVLAMRKKIFGKAA